MTPFVDTNVLLYLTPAGDAEPAKRDRALAIADEGCTISVQVLNEFISQSTRSTRDKKLTLIQALALTDTFRAFTIVPLDLPVFDNAAEIGRRTNYNWWDCLIVAAAIAGGCDTLLSEDMQHGHMIDGVRIVNPFRELA